MLEHEAKTAGFLWWETRIRLNVLQVYISLKFSGTKIVFLGINFWAMLQNRFRQQLGLMLGFCLVWSTWRLLHGLRMRKRR